MEKQVALLNYIAVGIGGIAGSILRYLVGLYTSGLWSSGLPYGTFIVNMAGCFALGFLTGWQYNKKLPPPAAAGIGTGFIGSFTTFSALSMETVELFHTSLFLALLYVVLSGIFGLAAAFLGVCIGEKSLRKETV
ncbi:fluoride efflux transporter CrcB [Siminovitchia sp. 179-K 8D1 HS]|uniref:fluoride efflux transporter CrcB n=1 Tax=Siminovitchia sp. 179-K 8D1 HS TaxID=3142385 RepID=UPI0039A3A64A